MTPGPLHRVRRMTFEEVRWRTRELASTLHDRLRFRVGTPRWPDTRNSSVASAVTDRLCRGESRCVIDPSLTLALREQVSARWPAARTDASARADRILAGNYDLLGYRGLTFSDWHSDPVHHRRAPLICWADIPYLDPSVGDHKIIWELNRHQSWLQLGRAYWLTGDPRYARAIVGQMGSWLESNPPLTGINWSSMLEISFRTISWTMAVHFLAGSTQLHAEDIPELPANCLAAIDMQLRHIEQHLSYYFSPNTHLTGEALALYVVGQAFPELAPSERWIETGRRILLREIERQIQRDGGHVERSTHYQRYTLDFYLLALLTARRAEDEEAARAFADAATRLAEFTQGVADDDGRLPLIGDDDGGTLWPIAGRECNDVRDSLATAAAALDRPDFAPWGLQEETLWVAAPEAMAFEARGDRDRVEQSGVGSRTFPDTGCVVMRAEGEHLVLDTGAHGYMNGGHAHADALSLTLSIGGRPLLVDPGTSTYTMDPQLRDRMRGSFSHNTLSLDGRPQSIAAGPFRWRTTVNARLRASRHNAGFDWAEGVHDGYSPIDHRRSVIRAEGAGWLVVDELVARGGDEIDQHAIHSASAHWHFHPGWMVRTDGSGKLHATHFDGDGAWLLFDAGELTLLHGNKETGLGWYAPVYGTLLPTWTACVTLTTKLPLSMVSWIDAAANGVVPAIERIAVNADTAGDAIGARVVDGNFASAYLLRPGEPTASDTRSGGILHYQTNARVLHFRTRGDALVALDLVDASHALALREGWVSIAASEPIPDLHLQLTGGILHLSASQPPQQLRIEGRAVAGVRQVLLNGRSHRPSSEIRSDTLVIFAADWARPPLGHLGVPFALEEVHPSRV